MRTITIFGGSGFVGRYIVQKFAENGDLIRVAVRHPETAQFLLPLGKAGQIILMRASILEDVSFAIEGSDVVINLVGILVQKGTQTFEALHVDGAQRIAKSAAKLGVSTLLHMSALGANKYSSSLYASTKARGEEGVLQEFPRATLLRPSVIFGPDDAFLNRFAKIARFSPVLPLIGGGKTCFQPIYVKDVADCFFKASLKSPGKIYELGGPSLYTFRALMEFLLKTIHRNRVLLPIPFCVAKGMAMLAQFLPDPPLTPDQVELLKTDNIVSSRFLTIESLGIKPKALEDVAPLYLRRYCSKGKQA